MLTGPVRTRRSVVAVLAVGLAACASAPASTYDRLSVDPPEGSPVHHVADDAHPALVLWVSNQSFREDEVGITVHIDDVAVIDGSLAVQDASEWVSFPLALRPGEHEVIAHSTDGVSLTETFSVPAAPEGRHAVLSYWFPLGPDGRPYFDWKLSAEPLQFG